MNTTLTPTTQGQPIEDTDISRNGVEGDEHPVLSVT